jgi:hypothetical protein
MKELSVHAERRTLELPKLPAAAPDQPDAFDEEVDAVGGQHVVRHHDVIDVQHGARVHDRDGVERKEPRSETVE